MISRELSLDLRGLPIYKAVSDREKVRRLELWVYKLGLKLDDVVPLQGLSNFERVELAINSYLGLVEGGR